MICYYRNLLLCLLLLFDERILPAFTQTTNNDSRLFSLIFGPPTDCNCVPKNLCQNNNDSSNSLDVRGVGFNKIRNCADSEVCCQNNYTTPLPITTSIAKEKSARTATCGKRNENGISGDINIRIIPNVNFEAMFGEFPWMVALFIRGENSGPSEYRCGGSLIDPKVVLIAAHCVFARKNEIENLIIRAGEWNIQSKDKILPTQERNVESIIIHEKYHIKQLHNDIALLLLKEKFDITESVNIVCLPPPGENVDNLNCTASGWGKDKFDQGVYQNILQKVDLPIVPKDTCQALLQTTRLGPKFTLHDSFMCAGGKPGLDTCTGDGGSPLVCPMKENPEYWYQVGIVSWGIGCGSTIPGVYVDVSYFANWIVQQFTNLNLTTFFYMN